MCAKALRRDYDTFQDSKAETQRTGPGEDSKGFVFT